MSLEKLLITVPASSANLGPGFDSVGIAVNRYLTLKVQSSEKWRFHSDSPELTGVPEGKENLIYEVAEHIAQELGGDLFPCDVEMISDIPLARGLGSSAAAIVAGIELANQLLKANLTVDEKVRFASLWEGHPDNVAPSIYGGLVVGSHSAERTDVVYCGVPAVDLVMLVPDKELLTKKARSILPEDLPFKEAIRGSGRANVLVAAIMQDNWQLAGEMMTRDIFHHPYRLPLVDGLEEVMKSIRDLGGYGAALSGAGPAIICFTEKHSGHVLQQKLAENYPGFSVERVEPASEGIKVEHYNTVIEK
ncbi:homoserine kinase [Alkalihalobacillus sp. BA299]|uniref:homoserine kinase n=1 Tax=Alkalihalobacillus sp. BA299 TaxID=2815938 RepID=UPI001ADD1753|nr:homoserine kinase [Alkalihalobacillus sp. BA299]